MKNLTTEGMSYTELTHVDGLLSQKTLTILAIALPIVLVFLLVCSVDFYLYRKRKTASRAYRLEAGEKLRVRDKVLTDTYFMDPCMEPKKRSSFISHIKTRNSFGSFRYFSRKQRSTVFDMYLPPLVRATSAMTFTNGSAAHHLPNGDSHVTPTDIHCI